MILNCGQRQIPRTSHCTPNHGFRITRPRMTPIGDPDLVHNHAMAWTPNDNKGAWRGEHEGGYS